MRERVRESKSRTGSSGGNGERELLAKVAEMPAPDRAIAERLHAIVKATTPSLGYRTWYGMPAYTKDGEVLCFFRSAAKFKTRYATLGFSDEAKLDEGSMWATDFALTKLSPADEGRIAALLKRAVG